MSGAGPDRIADALHRLGGELPCRTSHFRLHGRYAVTFVPESAPVPTPWVWYGPTFQSIRPCGEHFWLFSRLLERGIALAGLDVGESYGSPQGTAAYDTLYRHLIARRGFVPKPCLLAQSRGGLMHYNWASRHADRVAGIAGIFPVCDITSYPGLRRAAPAFGLTPRELAADLTRYNPVDLLEPLASRRVPILHLHGDADEGVPLQPNSAQLERRYRSMGGEMELSVIHGRGHEVVPEFFESPALLAFVGLRALPATGTSDS